MSCWYGHGPWHHCGHYPPPGCYPPAHYPPPEYYEEEVPPERRPRRRRRARDAEELTDYLRRLEEEIAKVRRDLEDLRESGGGD